MQCNSARTKIGNPVDHFLIPRLPVAILELAQIGSGLTGGNGDLWWVQKGRKAK
jgi:hypothetical protein